MNIEGRLFQAKMWRTYAMILGGQMPNPYGYTKEYVSKTLGLTREICLRRARVNLYLAKRLNRMDLQQRS